MQASISYELHTLENGVWKIQLVFDDEQEALIEARRIEEGVRPRETRIVEEACYESSGNIRRSRIVYTTPEITGQKPKATRPKPKAPRKNRQTQSKRDTSPPKPRKARERKSSRFPQGGSRPAATFISPSELVAILESHEDFQRGLRGGMRANLSAKNLSGFDFAGANLK